MGGKKKKGKEHIFSIPSRGNVEAYALLDIREFKQEGTLSTVQRQWGLICNSAWGGV